MRRIGIFSGSFDPIHFGHLQVARAALASLSLDQVLFAPIGKPLARVAHASPQDRAEMIRLMVQEEPGLDVSQVDLAMAPRYAVDTLTDLHRQQPGADFTYIVGADKLPDIPRWKDASRLFTLCQFAVYPRAGYDVDSAAQALRALGATLHTLPGEPVNLSSGRARAQLRLLSDAPGILSPDVAAYIAGKGLYQPGYEHMVRQAVSGPRFEHVLGVRDTAVKLARHYGQSMQKAGLAALLHDCAKNMELGRLQTIARQAQLQVDEQTMNSNALLHGLVGAHIARMRYHVNDAHILNAIAYHTTGRAGMNLLELCIFVADAMEPGRDYPGVDLIRRQAYADIRLAALTSLMGTRKHVRAKGMADSALTRQAIKDLKKRLRVPIYQDPYCN
ncbi:MAG: nicotinate (nicotinamide) nucleotide adenylyltransferase [Clostridiales bacterium]|nr:nicotinate (nicotinamide) nucleotide adenylyltransferase [Clostridiales bacterium]